MSANNSLMIHDVNEILVGAPTETTSSNGDTYYVRRIKIVDVDGNKLEITVFSDVRRGVEFTNKD